MTDDTLFFVVLCSIEYLLRCCVVRADGHLFGRTLLDCFVGKSISLDQQWTSAGNVGRMRSAVGSHWISIVAIVSAQSKRTSGNNVKAYILFKHNYGNC